MDFVFVNFPTYKINIDANFIAILQTCAVFLQTHMYLAGVEQEDTSAFLFQPSHYKQVYFCVFYLVPHFWCFFLVILLFKMASRCSAECYPVRFPLGRKHVLDKFCPGMNYNIVGCEFNVNDQQCILNKMSLSINTQKTRYVLIGWWKCCEQRPSGTWQCISPWSDGSVVTNSAFTVTSQNTTTTGNENQLCSVPTDPYSGSFSPQQNQSF